MPLTKTTFRENCLEKIKTASSHNQLYKNKKLNARLLRELSGVKNKRILFYYPLKFEVNLLKTLTKMREKNEVFIPFMQGESFKMVPFRLPLKEKKFGIFEAGNSLKNINKIDIAIVPAIGVDVNMQRIGFGKGMYDRFFSKLKKRPYIIFIQPELCYTNKPVCDDYDIACDLLLTPKIRMVSRTRTQKRK
ncbi:MAG: 5-formyltetrahydrofolate cyclo-ligase [Sulfurimonas sp.]|nr:5-formyltetrahydrofolate cyclo-ligase [Sulfurimonas sp.]MBU1217456.1 5-formyltetrahydrofolate cyclo-ligase [bacterium]MBU1433722.1 5-formyltetrahydrofolate cyclo-ligase [bacterium]MBU1503797.1 5-formyltetrahydrofolate cyclo-ligase [bacterium]MBU3939157.1 5-formyltetrahydrofolate cyclo-ligase [bacterium]